MIEFKTVELKDKVWMDPLIAVGNARSCHYNFTNIFAWGGVYKHRAAKVHDFLVVKGQSEENIQRYFYPVGRGDIRPVLEIMREDAAANEHVFSMVGLSPANIGELNRFYPDCFQYTEQRNSFDYLYLLDKLINLSGKKLQAKRNHINRFKKTYDNWLIEEITQDNLKDCWKMNVEWCIRHDCKDDKWLANEICAVRRCFENYDGLALDGLLLRVNGEIVAYTMGEMINTDTYNTHIEKAFSEIEGAYQMINREFAVFIKAKYPHAVYVNREEDMGLDGLRKAKLSYHPDKMEEKFTAVMIRNPGPCTK